MKGTEHKVTKTAGGTMLGFQPAGHEPILTDHITLVCPRPHMEALRNQGTNSQRHGPAAAP